MFKDVREVLFSKETNLRVAEFHILRKNEIENIVLFIQKKKFLENISFN